MRQQGSSRATARAMAAEGARVMICSRSAAPLEEAAGAIRRETGQAIDIVAADLSRLEGVETAAAMADQCLGRLDILVNNAGAIKGRDFLATPDEKWMTGWSLKLLASTRMARAVLPQMRTQGGRDVSSTWLAWRRATPQRPT